MRRGMIVLVLLSLMALVTTGVAGAQEPTPPAPPTPAPAHPATVRGTVTAIGDKALTVATERSGSVAVQIAETTRFHVPGFVRAGLGEVRTGDRVLVHGRWVEAGKTLAADWVIVRGPTQVRHGAIRRIDGAARRMEVETRRGEVISVEWTENTRLHLTGVISPTWSDLGAGHPVTVIGHWVEGTFLAGRVVARRPHRLFRGTLTAVDGTTLVLQTKDGEVRVATDAQTRFRVPGRPNASLSDLQPGMTVVVRAVGAPDGTWVARTVVARGPRPTAPAKPGEAGKGPRPTRRP